MSDAKRPDRKSVASETKRKTSVTADIKDDAWKENTKDWKTKYQTPDAQCEFFLLKNNEVARGDVLELLAQFKKYDKANSGMLEEVDIKKILEFRRMAKSPQEFRNMVDAIGDPDLGTSKTLSFLHFACAFFIKKWKVLFNNNANPTEVEKFSALRVEAEKNLTSWTNTLNTRQTVEKAARDEALAANQNNEEALNALAAVNATIAQHLKDDTKDKEALEEEKKAKLAKGKSGIFEAQAVQADPAKDKERIKRDAKDKSEKKKAQQTLSEADARNKKAKDDLTKAKEERIAAEVEVGKFDAEVKVYLEKQKACEQNRTEMELYIKLQTQFESESKTKAEGDAKAKEEARARLAAKSQSFAPKN